MQPSPLSLSVLFSALHSQTMATGSWGREILSHTVKGWNEETIQNSQLNETKEVSMEVALEGRPALLALQL